MQPSTSIQEIIRNLSERIIKAQKPIRILDAIKWSPKVRDFFFKNKFEKLPPIDSTYYQQMPLPYDPQEKIQEFYNIERDIHRSLGDLSGIGKIMQRMCLQYREVIRMLSARGTPEFSKISQELYGSSQDVFHAGAPSLKDLGSLLSDMLGNIKNSVTNDLDKKIYTSKQTVKIMQARLTEYFVDPPLPLRVELSDGILADASAGAEGIKIRKDAYFSERDIRLLEVHEGWVHIGTTYNGLSQPICTFLSKGVPSSTVTQEGLAIITEIFTFASSPTRVYRLANRINGIYMAEEGANFIEVFNFFRAQGLTEDESYTMAYRVFRGSTPDGGPFTKDLSYSKGFILIYNYIRLAVQHGLLSRIPLLFLGKTSLEDIHLLEELVEEKLVIPPRYLPPQFRDIAALSAWMCYSVFLNQISLERLAIDYKDLLNK